MKQHHLSEHRILLKSDKDAPPQTQENDAWTKWDCQQRQNTLEITTEMWQVEEHNIPQNFCSFDINQKNKRKKMKKSEETIRDFWDTNQWINIYITEKEGGG